MTGRRGGLQALLPVRKVQALTFVISNACAKHRTVCQQKQQASFKRTHCKSNDEMQPTPECGLKILQEPQTAPGAQAAFEVYNTAAMHCEDFNACKNTDFDEQITHVYHLDMSLPKILVVNQFTIT